MVAKHPLVPLTNRDPEAVNCSAIDVNPEDPADVEKGAGHKSLELTRTTTNALSRISTRLTSRHIQEPGPAPDGGFKAWLQVAMAWLVVVTTWGYLNSFAVFQTYYTDVQIGRAHV